MTAFAAYDAAQVAEHLDQAGCIEALRTAMGALSADERPQPLRSIIPVRDGRLFALMPGMATDAPGFGAKVFSVFHDPEQNGRAAHRGLVILFEEETGSVVCVADAHELTKIRTACNSAMATDVLAPDGAETLAVFGCGTQAESHLRALPHVRPIRQAQIWGRHAATTREFAARMNDEMDLEIRAVADPREAARADIICTVTGSPEPILMRDWVRPGAHVNAVGSSHAGPVEIDPRFVTGAYYYVEYRPSALAASAELIRAMDTLGVDESVIRAEIGEVINGTAPGRESPDAVTVYKSLGHIVQDLASARYLHQQSRNSP